EYVGVEVTTGVLRGSRSLETDLYRVSQSETPRELLRSMSGTDRAVSMGVFSSKLGNILSSRPSLMSREGSRSQMLISALAHSKMLEFPEMAVDGSLGMSMSWSEGASWMPSSGRCQCGFREQTETTLATLKDVNEGSDGGTTMGALEGQLAGRQGCYQAVAFISAQAAVDLDKPVDSIHPLPPHRHVVEEVTDDNGSPRRRSSSLCFEDIQAFTVLEHLHVCVDRRFAPRCDFNKTCQRHHTGQGFSSKAVPSEVVQVFERAAFAGVVPVPHTLHVLGAHPSAVVDNLNFERLHVKPDSHTARLGIDAVENELLDALLEGRDGDTGAEFTLDLNGQTLNHSVHKLGSLCMFGLLPVLIDHRATTQ
ncbi:hypothetical protein INR49_032571, partial [Caranx melampygus]